MNETGFSRMRKRFMGMKANVLRSVSATTRMTHVAVAVPVSSTPRSQRLRGAARTTHSEKSVELTANTVTNNVVARVFLSRSVFCS